MHWVDFFVTFQPSRDFGRFCNCRKNELRENLAIKNFVLRTKMGYENNIQSLELNSNFSSLYGIKCNSCLYSLKFFHVTSGLPPDLAHDLFEGFSIDFISNITLRCFSILL